MGKQWCLYKVTSSSDGASAVSQPTGKSSSAGKSRKRSSHIPSSSSSSSSFGGCMSAFFHLFDLHHHHHLPFHQPSFISEPSMEIPLQPHIIPKGVEAPRNSLELQEQEPRVEEEEEEHSSSSLKIKQETNFNIPMREIQIKTKRSRLIMEDTSSECSSSSPGTKTPSVVARLMGLDLLPENSSPRVSLSSPRVSSSSSHASRKYNTSSLPATPRTSTAQVDYHHRLSLQMGKENKRRYDDQSNTSHEYAKQIVKQVKESISRRVAGADITNTMRKDEHRRDEYLVLLKPNRQPPPSSAEKSRNLGKENELPLPYSSSPARVRLLEIKNNLNKPSSPLSSNSSPLMKVQKQKCKKMASEKYDLKLKKILHQQEEQYLKKLPNKKSTPLSNQLVKVNTATKFISFKKNMEEEESPSSTTLLLQKQVPLESITQLPSCQSRSYKTKQTHKHHIQETVSTNGNGVICVAGAGSSVSDYFDYISRILNHSGVEKTTIISISHWYSPSHPLHPSIFQQVEKNFQPTATSSAISSGDRKLIFDVVDELLVGILKPYISLKPWVTIQSSRHRMMGSELIGKLCEKVSSFPAADCQVLEDIDKLIEGDMGGMTRVVGETAYEEEAEEVVAEVERDVVDTVVNEVAMMMWKWKWKWKQDLTVVTW